ncbi:hypothetical protein F511_34850 [Dorcoceras hygrometricum]|uniref:Uncharacterized protein n=1 Tax=Dorcoceras hygrometricum TaxID=472368 RepID=A0A2Z7D025_9LAMI|nr:hypothetical protein F511_34850 [Dorcoceras hygrometricum]
MTRGSASYSSPSGASLRSSQQRDHFRGLIRAQILRGYSSRDLRASRGCRVNRGHSSRGLLPLDLEGYRCVRCAVRIIQDSAWRVQAGVITARNRGISLRISLGGRSPLVVFS